MQRRPIEGANTRQPQSCSSNTVSSVLQSVGKNLDATRFSVPFSGHETLSTSERLLVC